MSALYAISVRQAKGLLTASFRFHLAMDTLAVQLCASRHRARSGLPPVRFRPCRAHYVKTPIPLFGIGVLFFCAPAFAQLEFISPWKLLDGIFPAQGIAVGLANFLISQSQRPPAPGIFGPFSLLVGFESLFKIIGDAGV